MSEAGPQAWLRRSPRPATAHTQRSSSAITIWGMATGGLERQNKTQFLRQRVGVLDLNDEREKKPLHGLAWLEIPRYSGTESMFRVMI